MTPPPFLLAPGPLELIYTLDGHDFYRSRTAPAATRTSADGPPLAEPHDASSPDPDGGTP